MGSKIDFGDWLQTELNKRGMTQADLSRTSGLTTSIISKIITNQNFPEANTLLSIADGLHVLPDTVFRAAGLLPPIPERDAALEEALYILATLSDEDLQEMIAIARIKADRKAQQSPPTTKSRKKPPARSVLKNK